MKCPHCLENFHEEWKETYLTSGTHDGRWGARHCECPSCDKTIIQLESSNLNFGEWRQVIPKGMARTALSPEIDDLQTVNDYKEACLVLPDSPIASAALSRRCLQHILREKAGVKKADLSAEIQEVIDSNKLPTDLSENLDYVRNVGNFASHSNKSTHSGEVLDVEPGEAEWNLTIIEELMDYYFVRPARAQKKKIDLNVKLKAAGKPELPI
ncbi:MAG: DUF4145 domain-containing protein [bacterium]|nr:DUF4145 domain-containing protein [bacterium]